MLAPWLEAVRFGPLPLLSYRHRPNFAGAGPARRRTPLLFVHARSSLWDCIVPPPKPAHSPMLPGADENPRPSAEDVHTANRDRVDASDERSARRPESDLLGVGPLRSPCRIRGNCRAWRILLRSWTIHGAHPL